MTNCQICGKEMRTIPAGTSKTTGKPYSAFEACEDRTHKQPRAGYTPAPNTVGQQFSAQMDAQAEQAKWDKISEGKVRHGFAVEAYKMGKVLDLQTITQINNWVAYVMGKKIEVAKSEPMDTSDIQIQDYPTN